MPSLPRDLLPMLPARASEPFDSPAHLFELKWAGIRALAYVEGARLHLISQSGRDITALFPELTGMAAQVKGDGVVLDGEIVALGPEGEPDLSLIAARLAGGSAHDGVMCIYQAYDLLYSGGLSFLDRQLTQRKEDLARVLARPGPAILAEVVDSDGVALFEAASERRLPGVVAKLKTSRYRPGRTANEWLEVPVYELDNFVIGGYILGVGREDAVAGILLGKPMPGNGLEFAGLVQGNLPGASLEAVLAPLTTPACPFVTAPTLTRLVYWLKPELVCQVKFARRQTDGRLRFPVFVTLRPDLKSGTPAPAAARGRSAPGRS